MVGTANRRLGVFTAANQGKIILGVLGSTYAEFDADQDKEIFWFGSFESTCRKPLKFGIMYLY